MSLFTARRLGVLCGLVGIGLIPPSFMAGIKSLRICRNYTPDLYGIDISRIRFTGVDFQQMTFSWHDGCNWHGSPLLPLLVALFLIIVGFLLIGSPTIRSRF